MTSEEHRIESHEVRGFGIPRASLWLALPLVGGLLLVVTTVVMKSPAVAAISCPPHANTNEELQFISLLQSWRDTNISGSYPLTISGPLNAAAAHYAEYLANTPGAGGHYAEPGYTSGYPWATRAIDCGYPSNQAAGGEGLAVVESSAVISVNPQQALKIMTSEQGGGVWVPSNVGLPVKCVGAAKAVSTSGKKVAWVTLIFATSGTCPQAVPGGGGTSTTTVSPTSTLPTPTKTPTPTPTPHRAFAPLLSRDN